MGGLLNRKGLKWFAFSMADLFASVRCGTAEYKSSIVCSFVAFDALIFPVRRTENLSSHNRGEDLGVNAIRTTTGSGSDVNAENHDM